jgi:chemosensory pili system protein ChpC
MESQLEQMRGVLITLQGGKLLLPNTTVSEIISYIAPESVSDKPDWYLGAIRWKGYRLPLVSLSLVLGWPGAESSGGAKISILKALSGESKMPYYAILTQGFPRLVNIASDQLLDDPEHNSALYYSAYLNDETVTVPDLEKVENLIREHHI